MGHALGNLLGDTSSYPAILSKSIQYKLDMRLLGGKESEYPLF